MEWILTGVAVPLVIASLTAFGATWYATRNAERRQRSQENEVVTAAVRRYVRELKNLAIYLEEVEIAGSHWDPKTSVIDPGSLEAMRDAYRDAAPFFHRLNVLEDERAAISNSMPDLGRTPMDGSDNFGRRADLLQKVLDRGLLPSDQPK